MALVEGHNVVGCPAASIHRQKRKNHSQHVIQSEFNTKNMKMSADLLLAHSSEDASNVWLTFKSHDNAALRLKGKGRISFGD